MYQVPRILIEIDGDQFTKPTKKIPSHELPYYLERYGATVNIKEKLSDIFEVESLEQEWTRLCTQWGEAPTLAVFGRPPDGLTKALEEIAVKEKNVKNTSKSSDRTSSTTGV
jgi:hypothetical protein